MDHAAGAGTDDQNSPVAPIEGAEHGGMGVAAYLDGGKRMGVRRHVMPGAGIDRPGKPKAGMHAG